MVIIGLGRFGRRLAEIIESQPGIRCLGVDFDPGVVHEWKEKGLDILYGDMEDPDLLEQIPYRNSRMIVSTVANNELSQKLILTLRKIQPHKMAALQFFQVYLSEE